MIGKKFKIKSDFKPETGDQPEADKKISKWC